MKPSSAVASAFGWEFQSNAAIMLMIRNIERVSSVKVEGSIQDIELTFSDGKRLYSQAKSVYYPDDFTNVIEKLRQGLRTLNTAANSSNVDQLVFVTNSPNPFNNIKTMYRFSGQINMLNFSELPESCKQRITKICDENNYCFDMKMLSICVMQFSGESSHERFKALTMITSELLNQLEASKVSTEFILTLWQHMFTVNASKMDAQITKEQMIWPIIAQLCNINEHHPELDEYDEGSIAEILRKYKSIINNNSESFVFVTKVLSDYSNYNTRMKTRERTEQFITEKWKEYSSYFNMKCEDQSIMKIVTCLTIRSVLNSRYEITRIKSKVGLCEY